MLEFPDKNELQSLKIFFILTNIAGPDKMLQGLQMFAKVTV